MKINGCSKMFDLRLTGELFCHKFSHDQRASLMNEGHSHAYSQGRIQGGGGGGGGAKGAEAPPSKLMRCVTYILVKILTLI